jgi:hypothetical protein
VNTASELVQGGITEAGPGMGEASRQQLKCAWSRLRPNNLALQLFDELLPHGRPAPGASIAGGGTCMSTALDPGSGPAGHVHGTKTQLLPLSYL